MARKHDNIAHNTVVYLVVTSVIVNVVRPSNGVRKVSVCVYKFIGLVSANLNNVQSTTVLLLFIGCPPFTRRIMLCCRMSVCPLLAKRRLERASFYQTIHNVYRFVCLLVTAFGTVRLSSNFIRHIGSRRGLQ